MADPLPVKIEPDPKQPALPVAPVTPKTWSELVAWVMWKLIEQSPTVAVLLLVFGAILWTILVGFPTHVAPVIERMYMGNAARLEASLKAQKEADAERTKMIIDSYEHRFKMTWEQHERDRRMFERAMKLPPDDC